MRTTIAIDDNLLEAAKERARARGTTLGAVVEDALRREMAPREMNDVERPPVFRGGTGMRPEVDPTSNRAMRELLDEGEPGVVRG